MTKTPLVLTQSFPDQTYEAWEALAKAGMRGVPFESLQHQTEDGLSRGSLFTAKDRPKDNRPISRLQTPLLEGRPWHVCAPVRDPDIAFSNQQLLADLKGGASSLGISLGREAIILRHQADLKRLMEGVYLSLIPVRFDIQNRLYENSALILENPLFKETPLNLGLDPLGISLAGTPVDMEGLNAILHDLPLHVTAISINAAKVHEAGGTQAQELSVMAASAAAYWKKFGPSTKLSIRLAAGQDSHVEIAKFRAARRIINRIADAFDVKNNIDIHGVTSLRMMQSIDPWTNLLRVMSSGFGAICGGADYITLRPFTDAPVSQPRLATPFGYRIARNMQMMMMEESHLGQVNDVAHGSYFHESLSEDMAQTAWTEFQAIEAGGGIETLIESGALQNSIRAEKENRTARDEPILGVSLHPAENIRPA
jgi:methylmalonyl-CoA mutase